MIPRRPHTISTLFGNVHAARAVAIACWAMSGPAVSAQETAAAGAPTDEDLRRPITVTFVETPIRDVLFAFAEFADRSIVPGMAVEAVVSAEIRDQPWDVALRTLLAAYGLVVREREDGIIVVEDASRIPDQEAVAPLATRVFMATYVEAEELRDLVVPLLSERGAASVGPQTNTLVVNDLPRVLDEVGALVRTVDAPIRQVDIAAKIIFVNRSGLEALGITYDLKDVAGNQLNLLTPGTADLNGDGVVSLPDEQVPRGTDVISLGGNSLAALGNAANRIASPTLSLLGSLVLGRHTLIGFVDALESVQLTDVEAQPSVRVMDNRTARVVVGEETPVRVLDAGAQLQSGAGEESRATFPVATVDYKETGVILEVSPRITSNDEIVLNLSAERSSADLAPSDVGFVFRRQKAESQVLVKDGETVVIGGLTVTETNEVLSGIPVLMDIPLIGRMFRNRSQSSIQRDLLIVVTPKIVPSASP